MANRTNYYFKQRLTHQELNLGFDKLEEADRNFAVDLGVTGVVEGMIPSEQGPPSLSIDVSEGSAYDQLGRRTRLTALQAVDCSQSTSGINSEPSVAGNERWISVYIKFDTVDSEPRIDGASNNVFFLTDESVEFVVRVAPEAPLGLGTRVALQPDELLVCDVIRVAGQTTFLNSDIDLTRREVLLFLTAENIPVDSSAFVRLAPAEDNVQALADEIDAVLASHFAGSTDRHPAADIDVNDAPFAILSGTDAQAAFEAIDTLYDEHISGIADNHPAADVTLNDGAFIIIDGADVQAALADLDGDLDDHFNGANFEHSAADIIFAPHSYLSSTRVQAAIEELVDDLASQTPVTSGALRIGMDAQGGVFHAITDGSVRSALNQVINFINQDAQMFNVDHHGPAGPGLIGNHKVVDWNMTGDTDSFKLIARAGQEQAANFPRMRFYWIPALLFPALHLTMNARWDQGTLRWVADNPGGAVNASRWIFQVDISSDQTATRIQTKQDTSAPWADNDWDTEVHMGGDPSSLNRNTANFGDGHERGRCGLGGNQGQDGSQAVFGSDGVNFKGYFRLGPPSVVTLVTTVNLNWPTAPTVGFINDDGFRIVGSSNLIAEGVDAHWFGQYQATQ